MYSALARILAKKSRSIVTGFEEAVHFCKKDPKKSYMDTFENLKK